MASSPPASKQWSVSKNNAINSLENWRQNLVYTLSLDSNFAPFLANSTTWGKKTKTQSLHGYNNNRETVPLSKRLTAQQKVNFLELILGQITSYYPLISGNTIVKNLTST